MIKATLIARTIDGKIFYDSKLDKTTDQETVKAYQKSKEFLKSMANKPDRLSVEMSGGNVFK